MISIGKHNAVCRSTALGFSSKGTEQVALNFTIVGNDPDAGQGITLYRFFSSAALKYTVADLRKLGWTGDDPATIPESGFPTEVEIVVEHKEHNGKLRAEVKFINALGGGMKNRMDESQRKTFGSAMRSQIAALGSNSGGSFDGPPVDDRPPPTDDDGDLPFVTASMSFDRDPVTRARSV